MTVETFMEFVLVDPSTECWIWQRSRSTPGYGQMRIKTGPNTWKNVTTHKWAYEQIIKKVEPGLVLDHAACQRRACCNPAHLEEVTNHENIMRGDRKTQTHCKYGHSLDDAYIVHYKNRAPSRRCRTCSKVRRALGRKRA